MKMRLVSFGLISVLLLMIISAVAFASGANDDRSGAITITLGDVENGSVTRGTDNVDWWKFYVPESGGVVAFLASSLTEQYKIDFYMYNSSMQLIGSDSRMSELKPHFGTLLGNRYYYLKVVVGYSSQREINYTIGVAHSSNPHYLSRLLDSDTYPTTIEANGKAWMFVYVDSDDFHPHVYVFYNDSLQGQGKGQEQGSSANVGSLESFHWNGEIHTTITYDVNVTSLSGPGSYWIMRADE